MHFVQNQRVAQVGAGFDILEVPADQPWESIDNLSFQHLEHPWVGLILLAIEDRACQLATVSVFMVFQM
jgi:hypothetical protein